MFSHFSPLTSHEQRHNQTNLEPRFRLPPPKTRLNRPSLLPPHNPRFAIRNQNSPSAKRSRRSPFSGPKTRFYRRNHGFGPPAFLNFKICRSAQHRLESSVLYRLARKSGGVGPCGIGGLSGNFDGSTCMVRLRLKRTGRRHRPSYRVAAVDRRATRDGRVIEELGFYDPAQKTAEKQSNLKKERIEYWLSQGAQPSDTVRQLLKRTGITVPRN